MSIAFARARFVGRRSGGNAVRTAAYNERTNLVDERTGERFSFDDRPDKPLHHEVILPDGSDKRLLDPAHLWNMAEKAERRSDSIVAKELLLALPAEGEVSLEHKITLARSFAREHFVKHGLAVQLDVHDGHPVPGAMAAERPNVHVHIMASTRRVELDHFASHKARDLDPVVRAHDGRAFVASGDRWGELWREHQERHFERHGIETIVDPVAIHPERHGYGPRRRYGDRIEAAIHAHRERNTEAARDPQRVLEHLRSTQRVFDGRALDRFLEAHLPAAERDGIKAQVLGRLERAEDVVERPWFAGIVESWHRTPSPPAQPQRQRDHLADDLLKAITAALKSLDPQEQRERLAEGVDRAIYLRDPALPPSKLARSLMRVVTSALSVDEPERVLVEGTREAIRRHELRWQVRDEPERMVVQAPVVRPADTKPVQPEPRRMFGKIGRALERTLDWIAPRVSAPAAASSAQVRPEKAMPPIERSSPTKELGSSRTMSGDRRQERADSPLYQRYQQERQAAYEAREAAVREVNDRFTTYRAGVSAYYNTRFEIEKLPQRPGHERHDANEVLKAERGRDRVETQMMRSQQVAEARASHPLPDWKTFVARAAERGDREAQAIVARQQTRDRTRERGDNDLGL